MWPGRRSLLRITAFGPATAHDFSKWSGFRTSDARQVLDGLRAELAQVSVDGAPGWIRRADLKALTCSELDGSAVRLLGAFDSFLLAHATKAHLVAPRFYKRVYRPQGWISPVVLRGGTIIGVWSPKSVGKATMLTVELFARARPALRRAIERQDKPVVVGTGVNQLRRSPSCRARALPVRLEERSTGQRGSPGPPGCAPLPRSRAQPASAST